MKMHILLTIFQYISDGTSKENLSKYLDILTLVVTSFILVT